MHFIFLSLYKFPTMVKVDHFFFPFLVFNFHTNWRVKLNCYLHGKDSWEAVQSKNMFSLFNDKSIGVMLIKMGIKTTTKFAD